MRKSEWAAVKAATGLSLVAAVLLAGGWWWADQRAPDYRVGRRSVLVPNAPSTAVPRVRLGGESRAAWSLAAGSRLRLPAVVSGEAPVLRLREGARAPGGVLRVAMVTPDGRRVMLHAAPASVGGWALHRLPLPADVGDAIDIECVAGTPRRGVEPAELFVADLVIETAGRPVDESEAPVVSRVVLADPLTAFGGTLVLAPSSPQAERLGLPGPRCLELPPGEAWELSIPDAPGGRLEIVVHAAPLPNEDGETPSDAEVARAAASGSILFFAGGRTVARISLGFLGQGAREALVHLPLEAFDGSGLVVQRVGAPGLFVGLRDLLVTAPRPVLRRPHEPGVSRNVLLVIADSLRPDRLGCYGYDRGATPNLDALAARGLRYERVIAPSAWTLPNVASLLTGTAPSTHGLGLAAGRRLSPRLITLPQAAAWAGRETGGFSSSGWVSPEQGLDRGFQRFVTSVVPAPMVVEAALDWLADVQDFQWLALVHVSDATHPHEPEAADLLAVSGRPAPELLERLARLDSRPGAADALAVELGPKYDAEVAGIDRAVGELLRWLDDEDLAQDTLVVVVGAQGEEFFEHGGRLHGQHLHEEVVRVPLIVAGPGVPAGLVEEQMIPLVDVTRLIAELGDFGAEGSFQGRLPPPFRTRADSPYDRGEAVEPAMAFGLLEPYEGVTRHRRIAVREEQWLLLGEASEAGDADQLFDLEHDPRALDDLLAGDPPRPVMLMAEHLRRAHDNWVRATLRAAPSRPVMWEAQAP